MESEALVVADFATVFAIADDGPPLVGEVDPDLIFSPGEEIDFKKGALAHFLHDLVLRAGEPALSLIGRGKNPAGLILGKVALDGAFGGIGMTFDKSEVGLFSLFPIVLQGELGLLGAGEDKKSGGIAVEAVNNKDPLAGFVVPLFDVVIKRGMSSPPTIAPRSHRQESSRFVDHNDIAIFVKNLQPHRLMLLPWSFLFVLSHGRIMIRFPKTEKGKMMEPVPS